MTGKVSWRSPITRRDDVILSMLVGLLAGLAEAVNGIIRHRVAHLPTGEVVSGELFWYAPLAATLSMVVVALLLLALDVVPGLRARLRAFIPGVCAALGAYGLTRAMTIGIANSAAIILATGVGTIISRIVVARGAWIASVARRAVPVIGGALAVWAIALPLSRKLEERRALAALPPAVAGAPNVTVIIWDTVRAVSTSLYSYGRETTPELARLAERRGAGRSPRRRGRCSHASMFTGRYPTEMTVGFRAPSMTHPTLAEVLSARGYASAGITANLFYGSRDYGIARGFTWYDERPSFTPRVVAHTWWLSRRAMARFDESRGDHRNPLRRTAGSVNDAFLSWMRRRGERPFYAVLNHFDAHEPYRPPDPFPLAFSDTAPRYWAENSKDRTVASLGELRDAYDTSIRYVDHELGRLLGSLRESGVLDNTIIIVTADHGELFGEHGVAVTGHAHSLYAQEIHVPMVISYPPGMPSGVRRPETVSIRDIPATVMDIVAGNTGAFPGRSLVAVAGDRRDAADSTAPRLQVGEKHRWAADNPAWPTSAGDMFSVVKGNAHYILNAGGREELYDLVADLAEQHDLVADPRAGPTLEDLRRTLDSLASAGRGASRRVRR
jgi:arylsulfatase A-like enzyme